MRQNTKNTKNTREEHIFVLHLQLFLLKSYIETSPSLLCQSSSFLGQLGLGQLRAIGVPDFFPNITFVKTSLSLSAKKLKLCPRKTIKVLKTSTPQGCRPPLAP